MTLQFPLSGSFTFAASLLALVIVNTTGCGLQHSEYTVRADSIAVAPSTAPDSLSIRVYGRVANDGCGRLERVEKSVRGDTLIRRFVGETRRTNCTQMPITLDYAEVVHAPAGSSLVYAVQQPDGAKLVRRILSP